MTLKETDLYSPVKAHFEGLGYNVKAEVRGADVMAVKPDEAPVIIELKTGFSLILLQQGIARQALTDRVYLAVPRWKGKAGWRMFKGNLALCKRLGLGVISVNVAEQTVQVHHDPRPFVPRKNKAKSAKLVKEFATREGDPNLGGTPAGGRVTSYRQNAVRCRAHLLEHGPSKGHVVAKATGVAQATRIMADNHYGWFMRASLGVYVLTDAGLNVEIPLKSQSLLQNCTVGAPVVSPLVAKQFERRLWHKFFKSRLLTALLVLPNYAVLSLTGSEC